MKQKQIYLQMPYPYQKKLVNLLSNLCVLAPQINKKNISFYKKYAQSRNLLIDNAIFEGKAISENDYFELIKEIKPMYAILPDKFKDFEATFELHKKYFPIIKKYCKYPIAVFQPINKERKNVSIQQLYSLLNWCNLNEIEYVSIPYIPNIENNRFYVHTDREKIINTILYFFPKMKIHLLGLEHKSDLYLLKYKNVVSLDTTFFYANAFHKRNFCFLKAKHGLNFDTKRANNNILYNLQKQIEEINENSFSWGFTF